MKPFVYTVAVLFLTAISGFELIGNLVGTPIETPTAARPAQASPESTYVKLCASCHGKQGKGDGPVADALNPRPVDLTDSGFQASRTDQQLIEVITRGKKTMPGYKGRLSEARIRALVQYIRELADSNSS